MSTVVIIAVVVVMVVVAAVLAHGVGVFVSDFIWDRGYERGIADANAAAQRTLDAAQRALASDADAAFNDADIIASLNLSPEDAAKLGHVLGNAVQALVPTDTDAPPEVQRLVNVCRALAALAEKRRGA